ncbi:MAG: MlaD family protein [Acidimicrobiales bacterium]
MSGRIRTELRRLRREGLPSARDINKIALGVATLVVLGGMIGATFAVGALSLFTERYKMTAVFANSGGLKRGAAVRVAGVDVGQVANVSADYSTGQVLITFEVNDGVALGPDTRAEIGTTTFLGGDFLKLLSTDGSPQMQHLPRNERRIPLERTKTAFTLLSDLSALTQTAQELDPSAINSVLDDIGATITNNIGNIPGLVSDLQRLGGVLNARQDEFERLLTQGEQVAATLENRDQQLIQLVDQGFALLDALNSRRDELEQILGTGSDAVNRLADLVEEKRGVLEALLADLHTTLGAIDQGLPDLNAGLTYAGQVVNELAASIGTTADGTGFFNVMATGGSGFSLANLECIFDIVLLETAPCNGWPGF